MAHALIGAYTVGDTWTIAKRNLYRYIRLPQLLFFSSLQPIIFLLLFNYVFGGAIGNGIPPAADGKYINYLLPGILVQVTMFGGLQTGVGLADDMTRGIIDRFRSLPMSRIAVIAGRTLADTLRNVVVMAIMLTVGSLLGFRFHEGIGQGLAMAGIILLFGYALSWAFAFIGMTLRDAETAQLAGFLFVFPLVFASAAFVPVQTMPDWLQAFVRNQPITFVVNAARHFTLGVPADGAVWKTIVWSLGLLAIFVPLAIWQYRRRTV
ncbi:MAG TPA: ABC transporter permease [Nevskiaceae bacterium]|nr:ABC transporter permease [Nevskiaceae bacterium]